MMRWEKFTDGKFTRTEDKTMTVIAVQANPEDAAALARIQKRNAEQLGKPELGPAGLQGMMQSKQVKVFKIVKGEGIVAIAVCKEEDDGWFISDFAVDVSAEGQGIGRSGLVALLEVLDEEGVRKVTMRAGPDNERALKLYLSVGFIQVGFNPNFPGINKPRILLARENPRK